jgi:hypothetical protein
MKRRQMFLAVRIAALICFGLTIALLIHISSQPLWTPEGFIRIEPGMTLREVESLLGAPPGDYHQQKFVITEGTRTRRAIPPTTRRLVWFDEIHRYEIYFDADDRVVGTNERQQWLRSRPGWWERAFALLR